MYVKFELIMIDDDRRPKRISVQDADGNELKQIRADLQLPADMFTSERVEDLTNLFLQPALVAIMSEKDKEAKAVPAAK